MGKNKGRKRGYAVDHSSVVDDDIKRITDRAERMTMKPVEIRLSGPKHFFRDDDSVHILEFRTGVARSSYRNSVPLTTAELRDLRQTITDWLNDDYGPKPSAG
jgi:hypothetical protein